jgi:hypothetical protein
MNSVISPPFRKELLFRGNSSLPRGGGLPLLDKGTVQLSGFVSSDEQKSRAGDLAKKVDGVREVENHITV